MGQSPKQHAWQISSVQQLIGLSRRDIQRACYEGDGGVGILSPKDSTWGRRTYDETDLAKLFVVRQYKTHGLSLPEIRKEFDKAASEGEGYRELLDVQVDRLRERCDELADALVRAEALSRAVDNSNGEAEQELAELVATRALLDVGENGDVRAKATRIADVLQTLAVGGTQSEAAELLAVAGNTHALHAVLSAPGMDLVLELWLGAGTWERVVKTMKEASNHDEG